MSQSGDYSTSIHQYRNGVLIKSDSVATWDNNNGTHGRFASVNAAGDWQIGDIISNRDDLYLFGTGSGFNNINSLADWNVSKVTSMRNMFADLRTFNQPLNNWNVSKVTSMRNMFADRKNF